MSEKLAMQAVRRSNRFRVIMNVPLHIGLKQATLVDISTAGILATHTGMLQTESVVQISFTWNEQKFAGSAKVASCTVVGLGAGEKGATLYASRLYFQSLSPEARQMLETMVTAALE